MHDPIIIRNIDGEYKDEFGNIIHGEFSDAQIIIEGYNSILDLRGTSLQNSKIYIKNNVTCNIRNSIFNDNLSIFCDNSSIIFEDDCKVSDSRFFVLPSSNVHFGKNVAFWSFSEIVVELFTDLEIGEDFMGSSYIKIDTADGHSIFDVRTGKNINSDPSKLQNNRHCVKIGKHVWIGKDAFILGNTRIGNGSIVGARAFVKGKFPNNCIIAGIPAKIIRKDVAWSRVSYSNNINECNKKFVHMTSRAKITPYVIYTYIKNKLLKLLKH